MIKPEPGQTSTSFKGLAGSMVVKAAWVTGSQMRALWESALTTLREARPAKSTDSHDDADAEGGCACTGFLCGHQQQMKQVGMGGVG